MIKVGMLVSYDYKYLYKSIPLVYKQADKIVLALDIDRLTWSGNKLEIGDAFFKWVKQIDIDNKITIYEDKFYIKENTPMQNDSRERNLLAAFMGSGGWHIQIDSDEYFYEFDSFVTFLKENNKYLINPETSPVEICVQWITLFKKVEGGFLYIKDACEAIEIATNYPNYKYARANRYFNKKITKFILLHQSWARDEQEIYTKIMNWSHRYDSDNLAFFEKWKGINLSNYKNFKNLHERDPSKWKSLGYVSDEDIDKLKIEISAIDLLKLKLKKIIILGIREKLPEAVQRKIEYCYKKIF